jgi:hypothetical protein
MLMATRCLHDLIHHCAFAGFLPQSMTDDRLANVTKFASSAARCGGPTTIALAGRATRVPFTTVMSGSERIPADNPTAAVTCSIHRLRR